MFGYDGEVMCPFASVKLPPQEPKPKLKNILYYILQTLCG